MEAGAEASPQQHSRRKPVLHGLEDQKKLLRPDGSLLSGIEKPLDHPEPGSQSSPGCIEHMFKEEYAPQRLVLCTKKK
ncbi:hypothetical protein JOB18_034873 [Solea senegalensis]|uniref:Uncharacterized protein n=1 Tax=Solea senegalensis TaxID=28829 RepID=A0AAV6Q392_SOLSE|nr:hypothetical protein JOB18_034873 [Solea senegalensis]